MYIMRRIVILIAALIAATFNPLTGQAQEGYRIQPGDVLRIEVLEDSSINRDVLVLPDGRISVPLAGAVSAGGRTLGQVQASVAQQLAPNFSTGPTVFVSMSRLAVQDPNALDALGPTIAIYVLGEVNQPGKVLITEGTTLLQALAEIGGFSQFAARKRLQLRRVDVNGAERVYAVNFKDIMSGKSAIGRTVLAEGDVIIVPERRLFE